VCLGAGSLRSRILSLSLGSSTPVTIDQAARDDDFGNFFVVDVSNALHADCVAAPGFYLNFDSQLIAGNNGAAEAGFFDSGEDHQLVLAIGNLGEQQCAASLGYGFDDQPRLNLSV